MVNFVKFRFIKLSSGPVLFQRQDIRLISSFQSLVRPIRKKPTGSREEPRSSALWKNDFFIMTFINFIFTDQFKFF